MDKDKLLYRVSKEEGAALEMDMDEFYSKRRKGLIPFQTPEGKIEWLKRNQFRIEAAKKVNKTKRRKKVKRHHSHKSDDEALDLTNLFPKNELKYVFIGIGSLLILYLILKLVGIIIL